ncbi:ParB/RepB/Spo0J family partition protein [Bifidobacterium avesanii]|uniref:ParB/RepB/Spo0J family partition protein n=1 Tax=Bifidobacterium avesanii TaxID=1798157 RepID=A0A7K3THT0_9BIFI|nr:ParB/RepB/Spo0J family partition protein [Bifidobacterium avesanii]KAB8292006.1 chromosome partitioning protein ParB [Bifidobacterium avesanii]NEG78631.1 ParB/RepB/Spo0J family partition protein [Bifidobacterium avesanii]
MASRSRLGKGLGALFPTLPGDDEERKETGEQAPAADVSRETSPVTPKKKEKTSASSSSTGKKNNGRIKRSAVPALGDLTHPADMFFGGDSSSDAATSVAAQLLATVDNRNIATGAGANDVRTSVPAVQSVVNAGSTTDVSRETSSQATGDAPESASAASVAPAEPLKPVEGGYLAELKLADIGPNTHQPRTIFDEDELMELSDSIKEVGVLQPIVVRRRPKSQIAAAQVAKAALKQGSGEDVSRETSKNAFADRMDSPYELIMGERRWRASQLAGLKTIPAIVKTTADDDMLRDALLENLHRVALNPLEEAAAYQQMIKEFGLTQEQLAKSVSKSRPQIANMLRLLQLPPAVQKKVASGVLSAGHARALLGLESAEDMEKLAVRIIGEGLSVRSTEEIVAMMTMAEKESDKPKAQRKNNIWAGSAAQQSLENRFETKVAIKGTRKHGRIEITFSSPEDMDRIMALLNPDAPASDGWV